MKPRRRSKLIAQDNYYERHSCETIERVMIQMAGKPFSEVRSAIRASYPFGEKKGRPYKTWNRILLSYEAKLFTNNHPLRKPLLT